jgi:uncharacterized membrane protein
MNPSQPPAALSDHVNENIVTIASLRASTEQTINRHQRAVEATAAIIGRPRTVYLLLSSVAAWTLYNAAIAPALGYRQVDPPPFFWMQGAVAFYAALVTTVVLATQNRQNSEAERRGQLALQVNLMAEQRTAKTIALLEELRRDLPSVPNRVDRLADAMQESVDPKTVLSVLSEVDAMPQPDSDDEP